MKTTVLFALSILFAINSNAAPPYIHLGPSDVHWAGRGTGRETMFSGRGIVLKDSDKLVTPDSFRPPVEITIVAKTDSTNIRMGYAADQVIFNWEENMDQLRVDGGPADGRHVDGAGRIPKDSYVSIRWVVTPEHQAIYVNDRLRFEDCGIYENIDKPVSIFPANGSVVTVKSVTVERQ